MSLTVYGMTELQGPSTLCVPQDGWGKLPLEERAALTARQGVRYPVVEGHMVADPKSLRPVPQDGKTIGEIMVRGNTVMLGYLKEPKATADIFRGGWMRTGDLAVEHPDGYVEIKDRAKDIIISGGENISSVEVEIALYKHPAVQLAAVVARPDQKWGETPCAFVQLKLGAKASAEEIIAFCRDQLAHFKAPKSVVFGPLPTTATGKIQKFVLRERARARSRKTNFWILPVAVVGSGPNTTDLGALKCASWSRQKAIISSAFALAPSLSCTKAHGVSPHF